MKNLILCSLLMSASLSAFAEKAVLECVSPEGMKIVVYEKGNGEGIASIENWQEHRGFNLWCDGKIKESNSKLVIEYKTPFIEEEPNKCKFELNKKKMTATYNFKEWKGYVRMPLQKPDIDNTTTLKCVEL